MCFFPNAGRDKYGVIVVHCQNFTLSQLPHNKLAHSALTPFMIVDVFVCQSCLYYHESVVFIHYFHVRYAPMDSCVIKVMDSHYDSLEYLAQLKLRSRFGVVCNHNISVRALFRQLTVTSSPTRDSRHGIQSSKPAQRQCLHQHVSMGTFALPIFGFIKFQLP